MSRLTPDKETDNKSDNHHFINISIFTGEINSPDKINSYYKRREKHGFKKND